MGQGRHPCMVPSEDRAPEPRDGTPGFLETGRRTVSRDADEWELGVPVGLEPWRGDGPLLPNRCWACACAPGSVVPVTWVGGVTVPEFSLS